MIRITPEGFDRLRQIQHDAPTQTWCPKCSRAIDLDGQPASSRARCLDCGTSIEPPDDRRIGKYRIVREIARGGMGIVYEAEDPDLRRRVALKILRDSDDEQVQRLHREAAIAAQLQHPHIVAVHEVGMVRGPDGPIHFIVMDLVEGRTMADAPPEDRLRILEDVARAVEFAHRKGVVHRDLKPSNVLIDATGHVRLTDFGIARAEGFKTRLTASMALMGTPGYMSPEQVLGDRNRIGAPSDIYTLGVMLYEHLAGALPFPGDGPAQILNAILIEDPPPLPRSVPRDLQVICFKAMARERERRYGSAEAFADDLRRHRSGESIAARPPSMAYRVARVLRRHRASAAALAATIVLGTIAATMVWREQRYSRQWSAAMDSVNQFLSYSKGDHTDLAEFRRLGDAAIDALTAARALKPGAPEPAVFLARCLSLRDRHDEAAAILDEALARNDDGRLHFERAKVLSDRYLDMRGTPIIQMESKSIRRLPLDAESPEARAVRLKAEIDITAARSAGLDAHRLALLDAYLAMGTENYAAAAEGASVYLRHEPWDFEVTGFLARALNFNGQYAESAAAWGRYLGFRRTSVAYYGRAISYVLAGDRQRAREDLRQVVSLQPELAEAHHLLGLAEYGLGNTQEALRCFTRTIDLRPDHAAARNNRALCRAELGDPKGALEDLTRAEALGIRTAELYVNRGDCHKMLDRLDEALADLNRAIELNDRLAVAYLSRGSVKFLMGKYADTIKDCERGLEIGGMNERLQEVAREMIRQAKERLAREEF